MQENSVGQPPVSVLVPAYNAEPYIRECMDSLVSQTLTGIEVIVIDDGSTDATGEILDSYAKEHSFVRVYHQENKGLYKTREIAAGLANGEYIGWVDADDFVDATMYEVLYKLAKENSSDLAYCNYQFYPDKIATKEKWFREFKGNYDVEYVERNSQPWNKIVSRKLFFDAGIASKFVTCFDEIYIKLLLTAKKPVSTSEELYYYRMGQPTMSSSYTNTEHYKRFVQASTSLKAEMEAFCENSPYWKAYFEYREEYYTLMAMLVAANAADKKEYHALREQLLAYSPSFHSNMHIKPILRRNFGKLKAFAIERIVPSNYCFAKLMSKLAFK